MGWINHGTAVVGVFGGDENAIGIIGICPNANTRAISIFGPDMGSPVAIRQAADALSPGDIILIELHRPGPRLTSLRDDQAGYIAVEWWPDDFAAIRYAVSRGVIVVEAAGNGAENLNDVLYNTLGLVSRPHGEIRSGWTIYNQEPLLWVRVHPSGHPRPEPRPRSLPAGFFQPRRTGRCTGLGPRGNNYGLRRLQGSGS